MNKNYLYVGAYRLDFYDRWSNFPHYAQTEKYGRGWFSDLVIAAWCFTALKELHLKVKWWGGKVSWHSGCKIEWKPKVI